MVVGIIKPIYALFLCLFFFSSVSALLANLNIVLQRTANKFVENFSLAALALLIGCGFWFFGWKCGLASIAFIYASNITIGSLIRRMLNGNNAVPMAEMLVGNDDAVSNAEIVAKCIPSIFSLLFPLAATLWIGSSAEASAYDVIGYGMANLGYLMFFAAWGAGTFNVFHLTRRWQLYVAGTALIVAGTVIVNFKAIETMF